MRAPVLPQSPILWRARQQDPTTQPTSTLSQRRKQPGSAWFCSYRRGDVSFWHCPPPLGPKPWHVGPTRILLVGLPQVPRPAQPGPCRGSCPSSLELSLRHVIWVEGGGLTSFKSKRRKHIHIQVRKRHLPLQLTQARSPPKLVALPPTSCYLSQIPHRLLLLGYWTLEPHAGRGERKGVLPTKTLPKPQLWRISFLLTFQTTSWFPWPFSWNLEKVVSSADYLLLWGEGASQPDPSGLQIPSLFQLLENKISVKTLLCKTVQTHSWPWEWLLLNYWQPPCQENGASRDGKIHEKCPMFLLHGPGWECSKAMLCFS